MKTLPLLLLSCLLIFLGFSELWAKSDAVKTAASAAQTWLALNDNGEYSTSWKEASTYFRGAITEAKWGASMEGFRKPLGKVVTRKIVKTQESKSLPGAPDGKYIVMQFRASFESKKSATETVTFMVDNDGKWRAAGYFIK